ncbi:hypothetical protein F2Q70_00009338, partial [Brassica cretica]
QPIAILEFGAILVCPKSLVERYSYSTLVPTKRGQPIAILEFGAILVCPKSLVERYSYSTLVRPTDLSLISTLSKRRSGITPAGVLSAPTFLEIAPDFYDILNGRVWAGHNIKRFDCPRIRDAYAEIVKLHQSRKLLSIRFHC